MFDWSDSNGSTRKKNNVKWAAFIGGCDYRVHPIEKGEQVLLMYTLTLTQRVGGILDPRPIMDSLPLYESVKTMLGNPGFLRHGSLL